MRATKTHCKRGRPRTPENVDKFGACKACRASARRHYDAAWKKANPDKMRAWEAAWKKAHPEYQAYLHARERCTNPKHPAYQDYGGRGIKFCFEDGRLGFLTFLFHIGGLRPPNPPGWTGKRAYWSVDRINNDGHYAPGNVHWATPEEQARNTRKCTPPIPLKQEDAAKS